MITLLFISLVVFMAYTAITTKIYGVPNSITDTHFSIEESHPKSTWVYTLACWLTGGLALPFMLETNTGDGQFLGFFSFIGMLILGLIPLMKISNKITDYIVVGATVVVSQLWIGTSEIFWMLFVTWGLFLAYAVYFIIKNKSLGFKTVIVNMKPVFFAEIASIAGVYAVTIIHMLNGGFGN